MLGSPRPHLKGMRRVMLQPSGFYFAALKPDARERRMLGLGGLGLKFKGLGPRNQVFLPLPV